MKKSITIPSNLQTVLTPEEVALVVQTKGSSVLRDLTCQLGAPQYRSVKRHSVVIYRDLEG